MRIKISDMMDHIEDVSVNIHEKEIASIHKIKEETMKKIQTGTSAANAKKIPKAGIIVAVLVLSMLVTGTVFACVNWNGFSYISGMTKSQKNALLKNSMETSSETVDSDGNVHYVDANGNEVVLSAKEADEKRQEEITDQEQAVQDSTALLDVYTLPIVPNGITEMITDKKGKFEDFALGNGYMVLLHPQGQERYFLKKDDTVTISLAANDDCILEFGMIKDGNAVEADAVQGKNHLYTIHITEDGEYNFYIMYGSADKSLFTDCVLTIESDVN